MTDLCQPINQLIKNGRPDQIAITDTQARRAGRHTVTYTPGDQHNLHLLTISRGHLRPSPRIIIAIRTALQQLYPKLIIISGPYCGRSERRHGIFFTAAIPQRRPHPNVNIGCGFLRPQGTVQKETS